MTYTIHHGNCLDILPTIPSGSIDAVITDPPYPEISRDYGRLTEDEWWALMMGVCTEVRRVLKPTGSAVFILQPNSRKVGSMRGWLWRFMWWVTTDWNMVQDVWWWNIAALPVGGAITADLTRASLKSCIWAGGADCYRNQLNVLWDETLSNFTARARGRFARHGSPSGRKKNDATMLTAAEARGGVTPYNVLPIPNNWSPQHSGNSGHGAGTPLKLADWWTRYIVPTGGTVLDPFNGAGTMGVAAIMQGCNYIGIEKEERYVEVTKKRLDATQPGVSMLAAAPLSCDTKNIDKSDCLGRLQTEHQQSLGMGGYDERV